ncbi:DUF393 domain-containing protein [Flammeovirga pectinis]|uniref:DUF393 domain-containing protein n=1 Tax=Flammeovirga pectinis TaxID=2494373 RepID=A0A3Q9FP42_9BACT|nr:DUF393 domain-containing protein [Flammeovirga pectinis]AZQ61573.1 DUF393 domain-containing protein [Flammeovirga pectinis]
MIEEKKIILFDGICNLCDHSVQFIIRNEKSDIFQFCSLQSEEGMHLLKHYNLPLDYTDSIVLISENKAFTKSNAALKIAKHLKFPLSIIALGKFLPEKFNNFWYDLIAKYRYKLFGKKTDTCELIHQNKKYTASNK